MRRALLLAVLALGVLAPGAGAAAIPGRVIVGFDDGATAAQREAARHSVDAQDVQPLGEQETQELMVPGADDATLAQLRRAPGVDWAEPVFETAGALTPPTSNFAAQWPLANNGANGGVFDADIDAPRAWDLVGGGSPSVLVGVADSGVQPYHPGLDGINLWTNPNPSERASKRPDGRDNDGDGCVDDLHGCDTVTKGARPYDENGHGTAVAGIVFANWLASSVDAGIAPNVGFVPAKVLNNSGAGTTAQLAAGLQFLGDVGARVVNVSIGAPYSEAVHQAIASHPDTLFVASAGNAGVNVDAIPSYPCEDTSPNVICVAASNRQDTLASFSNYGTTGVDLAAPGASVPSLALGDGTGVFNGTSFAAPMVTGTAALAFSARPSASVAEVKAAILGSVDGVPALTGKVSTGGRVNAYNTVARMLGIAVTPRSAVATGGPATAGAPGAAATTGSFTTTGKAKTPATATLTGVALRATARRKGAKAIAARVTCVAAKGCRQTITIVAGGRRMHPRLVLKRNATKMLTLRVARSAAIKAITITSGSGALTTRLTVSVRTPLRGSA